MRVVNTERIPIKLWLDDIENTALQQARNLANLPFAYKWVAIMPDSHPGYGMPIGGVLAAADVIVPNAVGVDIGCGMCAVKTSLTHIDRGLLEDVLTEIRSVIPVGFDHQHDKQHWDGFNDAPDIPIIQQELESARKQLGTLGSGNHFIEIQKGDDSRVWAMIHSGSRNFGLKTAEAYFHVARKLCEKYPNDLPDRDLSFLPMETHEAQEYFKAMNYCLRFAQANRDLMMQRITDILADICGASVLETINIHHNYAAFETHYGKEVLVHRKGATRADAGLTGIIPGSMGTCSYITEGLGNPESFMSSSHGAGRRMGRNEATRRLDFAEEQRKMSGIVHHLRSKHDLDEAPGAYKDIDQVMRDQQDLVKIKVKLKPLGGIKG